MVHDWATFAIRAATSGESDAQGAQKLLETLQQYQKARSESKQNTRIQHNSEIIKHQLGTMTTLKHEIAELLMKKKEVQKDIESLEKSASSKQGKENRVPAQESRVPAPVERLALSGRRVRPSEQRVRPSVSERSGLSAFEFW